MPMYEYRCGQCGQVFELIQRFSDEPLTVHEGCGGSVEKLISAPSFQFKGTGFYITDYAKGASGGANPPPSSDSTKGDTSSASEKNGGSSKEAKPGSSKEAKPASAPSPASSSSSSTTSSDTKK